MSDSWRRQYSLKERTCECACDVRVFVRQLPHTLSNAEHVKQLVLASGLVVANYIEANEAQQQGLWNANQVCW